MSYITEAFQEHHLDLSPRTAWLQVDLLNRTFECGALFGPFNSLTISRIERVHTDNLLFPGRCEEYSLKPSLAEDTFQHRH